MDAAARWLAGFGLAEPCVAPCPVTDLLFATRRHRMTGLLARAVADGAIPADPDDRAAVFDAAAAGASACVAIEVRAASLLAQLHSQGVRPVVLKGCAVAHLDYSPPADREFIDADLLVGGDDLAAVLGALDEWGYQRDLPERAPGFDARFGKDITMQQDGWPEIDVHVRIAFGAFGQRLDPARLVDRLESFDLAGVKTWALDTPGRLVHSCYNAVLADGQPRLVALRDVAVMVRAGSVGVTELRERAREWGGEAVVAAAVTRAWTDLGLVVDHEIPRWALGHRPNWPDRQLLRTYPSLGGAFSVCLLAGVAGVSGLGNRCRYVRAFVSPNRSYRDARRRAGRVNEYREGARQIIRMVRGRRG